MTYPEDAREEMTCLEASILLERVVVGPFLKNAHWRFTDLPETGGFLLQLGWLAPDTSGSGPYFARPDVLQTGRKFYVSRFARPSEVVQTAFLAVKLALEHEARETFTLDGVAIFSPHFDLQAATAGKKDERP